MMRPAARATPTIERIPIPERAFPDETVTTPSVGDGIMVVVDVRVVVDSMLGTGTVELSKGVVDARVSDGASEQGGVLLMSEEPPTFSQIVVRVGISVDPVVVGVSTAVVSSLGSGSSGD